MLTLRLFGSLDLREDGGPSLDSLLRQPKRVAFLTYLAIGADGYHRKDTLVGLFYPESTQDQARHALRQALYVLRQELGDESVLTRGDEEVALNREVVTTDVEAFDRALQEGCPQTAVDLYCGELLEGFFLANSPCFEEWLERERARRRTQVVDALRVLMDREEASGNDAAAARWGRRFLELAPHDEAGARRVMVLLAELGDRGGAIRLYEGFAQRMAKDLELEPSLQTRQLVEQIRADGGGQPPSFVAPTGVQSERAPTRRNRLRVALLSGVAVVLAAAGAALIGLRMGSSSGLVPNRVVVVPFENQTGDTSLASLGEYLAFYSVQLLAHVPEMEIVPANEVVTRLRWADRDTATVRASALDVAEELGAAVMVQGFYNRQGDQLEFYSQLVDVARNIVEKSLESVHASTEAPIDLASKVAQSVSGALLARFNTDIDLAGVTTPPSLEVFQAMREGGEHMMAQRYGAAERYFRQAIALDSTYIPPYLTLGTVLSWTWRWQSADSLTRALSRIVAQAGVRIAPSERVVVDLLNALVAGDRDRVLADVRQALALSPTSTLLQSTAGFEAYQSNRPREALATWGRINADVPVGGAVHNAVNHWMNLSSAHHLLGDYRQELRLASLTKERFPDKALGPGSAETPRDFLELRALVGLGRVTDALEVFDNSLGLRNNLQWSHYAGLEFERHGHDSAATVVYTRIGQRYEGMSEEEAAHVIPRMWYARALMRLGELSQAQDLYTQLTSQFPNAVMFKGELGAVEAGLGNRQRASEIKEGLRTDERPYLYGKNLAWSARIAAALGEREEAVRLLRQAFARGLVYNHYLYVEYHGVWHSDAYFKPLWGYDPFEELMRPKG